MSGGRIIGGRYEILVPVAYRGKQGCTSVTCTRLIGPDGIDFSEPCMGWHCSYCDAPCSSQGHRCDAAEAVLDAARAIREESA